jgi:hypothetical protein
MGNGYLGKISAIVSANTADFDSKLSRSAKEVSAFARSVQSNLTSASSRAAKSLEGIYTPLQKLERSLQAAASMKLSFKGFPGMIKDLDALQQRLNSTLSKRQIDIVLKTTGLKSITEVRDALYGLKSQDIEIITRLGGLEKVNQLREQIRSSKPVLEVQANVDEARNRVASLGKQLKAVRESGGTVAVSIDAEKVDKLTGQLSKATAALANLRSQAAASGGSKAIDQINVSLDALEGKRAKLETKALRVRGDERALQATNAEIDKVTAKIDALNARKATLSVSTEDFNAKLAKSQDRVEKLSAALEIARGIGATNDVQLLEKELADAEKQAAKLERRLAKTIRVEVGVDADLATLDAVAQKAERAGGVLGKLNALMNNLGRADFSAASDKMRQLQSVATEITKPLESSVAKLSGLGASVAGAFQQALMETQKSVEMINAAIERQGSSSGTLQDKTLESYYASVLQKVERTISSIERLNQVAQQTGQIKTGREFVFEQPGLNEAINRGADIGNQAAALPAEAIQTNPAIVQSLTEIRRLADEAGVAYAKFLSIKDQKQPTGEAQKELDAVVKKLLEAQGVAEREIKVVLDVAEADAKATALKAKIVSLKQDVAFTVTGKVQNFDQARGEVSRLQADLGKLDASQRAPIARKVVALGKLVEAGDVNSLETVRNLIQQIEKAVGRKLRITLEKEQAQRAAQELAASLAKFRESISFTVTSKVQNVEQARSELGRLQSDVDKLTESQKIAIEPKLQALGELVAGNQITDLEQVRKLIAEIAAQAGSAITLKIQKDEAEKAVDSLKAKMDQVREQNAFVITGRPQNMEQAESRESSLRGEVGQLRGPQRAKFRGLLEDAAVARETGDLVKYNDALDKIDVRLAKAKRFNVRTADAKKSLDDLNKDLRSIADSLGPPVGMNRLKESTQAADAAVEKLAAGLDKARLKADIGQLRVELGAAESLPAGVAKDQAINSISTRAESITQDAGRVAVDADTVEKARTRIGSLDEAWAASIRGLPETETQIDEFFKRVLADIGKFEAADRISFDPMISSIRQLIATGAPISAVADALLQLEDAQKKVNAAGKQSETIAKLSPGSVKDDLQQRLEAAKQRATTPMALAGESVEDVGKEADVRLSLGKDIGDSSRQLEVLKGGITSVKGNLDRLPESVRSRFIPAIQDAEREFTDLSMSASPLAADIERARQRLTQLTQDANRAAQAMNFRESFGGGGLEGVNLGLDQRALQSYSAQLQILQNAIGRASAEARGPAVDAFNRLRNAVATAFDEGNIDSNQARASLGALRTEAIAAAASVSRIRVGTLTRDIGRAGDIGRKGFDRFALAVNQGAYVVDDFLSSTGGLEQKLRAIGNNVTQLGFVLGGTTGLVIGLGAVLVGQLAVGIVKWINNGRTAEDQTKALNESLARQKTLVEGLAEAFRTLGDSMSQGTYSKAGQADRDFNKQREEIVKKQKELRDNRITDLDRGVQTERAQQNSIRRDLEKETNIGRRVALQSQLDESERREKERMRVVGELPTPTGEDVAAKIESAANRQERVGRQMRPYDVEFPVADAVRGATAGLEVGNTPEAIRSQMEAIAQASEALQAASSDTIFGYFQSPEALAANASIDELAQISARLAEGLTEAIDGVAVSVLNASRGPAESIRNAQEEVAEAIKSGIPGARLFGIELDKNAKALEDSYKKLEEANKEDDGSANKEKLINEANANIVDLQARRANIEKQADALRYERTVDPQRQMDARAERVGANLGDAGLQSGQIARRMREIENQRETIRQQASKEENQNPAMQGFFEGQEAALNAEVAAIEAATIAVKIFAQALDKASEEAKSNLNSAQQAADESRRADLGNSTPQTQADRKRAEDDLERQRQTERDAQTEIAVQRDRQEQMAASPEAVRLQQINEELASGTTNADQEKKRMVARRGEIGAEVDAANAAAGADVARATEKKRAYDEAGAATNAIFAKARELGIDASGGTSDVYRRMQEAGHGDVAAELDRNLVEKQRAVEAMGGIGGGVGFWDAVAAAADELAAAIAHQAEVVAEGTTRLADIDAEIAAAPEGDREALIRERDAIQADMEDKARASQADVNAKRDASTREEEQRKSADRGAQLSRKPDENFAAETQAGMNDIKTYYERRAEANNGLRPAGDAEAQAEAEKRFREERAKEARTATKAGRGREAFLTEGEKFARDSREGIVADMTAGAIDQAGVMNVNGRRDLLEKGIKNQMETVAPMLQQFEEERQNALLQGPSRAALKATDVSTSEGAAELTRLIRGDDSAKDVNLAELRKQTQKFDALIEAVKAANPGVLL